jgi:hypothetical protein
MEARKKDKLRQIQKIVRHIYLHGSNCDDLKFDNKFEVPVMYSTAILEPLLRYT